MNIEFLCERLAGVAHLPLVDSLGACIGLHRPGRHGTVPLPRAKRGLIEPYRLPPAAMRPSSKFLIAGFVVLVVGLGWSQYYAAAIYPWGAWPPPPAPYCSSGGPCPQPSVLPADVQPPYIFGDSLAILGLVLLAVGVIRASMRHWRPREDLSSQGRYP